MARLTRIAGVAASLAIVYAASVGVATRIRASGGPFFPPQVFTLTAAPDGAWTFFGGPRALHHAGWTYFGYVDTSGNVCVRTFQHSTASVGAEIICKATLDVDDHVNPSFLIRPDGKLQVFYARHEPLSDTMHTRVSVSTLASDPDLSDGFAAEVSLDAQLLATSYDYPWPIYLSAEDTIWLFWRSIPSGNNYNLIYAKSTDGGDTWTDTTTLFHHDTKTHRSYWQIASNGVDRIDFAITDGSPNTDTTHLGHMYYDGAWKGTAGGSLGSPSFDFADLTAVYTAANTWVLDIALVSGSPRILHPTYPTEFTDHRYNEARWTGAAWTSTQITAAGGGIDSTGAYSGGVAYDQADPTRVYASREVSGQFEMYRYQRTSETWAGTALTTGSASKNVRPVVPKDHAAGLAVYWMFGSYSGYETFNTGIKGIG